MKLDLDQTLDSAKDGIKETAETVHSKTKDFHEKYVSKVIPDFGKYGDVANFTLGMVPGYDEYNAIKDGDWQAFAISAGIDVGSFVLGAATAGIGGAALKGGSAVAKLAAKKATKEIAEAGMKKVAKEGVEKVAKESVEKITKESVEKIAKEGAEKFAKEGTEKTIKEGTEKVAEVAEKITLKTGDRIRKEFFPEYIDEIEKITKRKMPEIQKQRIKEALDLNDFKKLPSESIEKNRKQFNSNRKNLINEWEKMTNQKWPRYETDVLNKNGKAVRAAGQPYDVHHIIELNVGGPNESWNIHPASYLDEHQLGIHGSNSFALKIFGK